MSDTEKLYRRNVAIIAFRGKEVLIVHKPRKNDAWQFPQGGVEEGEEEYAAVLREFKEEAGNEPITIIKKSEHQYKYDFPSGYERFEGQKQIYIGQEQSFWLVRFEGEKSGIVLDEDELDKYEWILPQDLDHYIVRPEYLEVCRRVLKEFKLLD